MSFKTHIFASQFYFLGYKEKKDFCAKDNKVEIRCEFPSFRECERMKICF